MSDYSIRSLWLRLSAPDFYHRPVPELLRLSAASNQKAYCALYDRFKREIVRYAYFLSENEKRSQSLTQNAFLKGYQQCREILGQGDDFRAWLYREVTREYLAPFASQETNEVQKPEGHIDWQALRKMHQQDLLIALEEMSAKQRASLLIWILSSLSDEQQAWVFNLRSQNWNAQLQESLKELSFWRQQLSQEKVHGQ